jgi:UTP--glucose-1-phosphate uridylyltransferase
VVVIKLNGGLGTSMGLQKAKTLLRIKRELTFLDVIARQALRREVPLLLMNSFNTQADSLAALGGYPGLSRELPRDFRQHMVPKVVRADYSPAMWPANPELEWNPPGHGDLYIALETSGLLDRLLQSGYRYAFVSNADNLGAVLDDYLLGYFASEELPFMMETTERTHMDRKGGHLAFDQEGRFILRESAQCAPEDLAYLQDVERHRFVNTNNLWLNLPRLKQTLIERDFVLGLPMIRNAKTVDPRDSSSTPVFQLETAMGSAIGVFEGAGAVRVPRSRFAPVKTTEDLLIVRSDAFVLTEDDRIVLSPDRESVPVVTLDAQYYRLIEALDARFPFGPPSLVSCDALTLSGDVRFGKDVRLAGRVNLQAGEQPFDIADGALIAGE